MPTANAPSVCPSEAFKSAVHQVFHDIDLYDIAHFVLIPGQVPGSTYPFGNFVLGDSQFIWIVRVAECEVNSSFARPVDTVIADSMRDIFKEYGVIGLLYAIMWANTCGKLMRERSSFWRSQIQAEAKKYLHPRVNSLARVPGRTLGVIAQLEMGLRRAERQATFKNDDFYFGVKDGEFVLLEHDAAVELKEDVVDIGIKAVVQPYTKF